MSEHSFSEIRSRKELWAAQLAMENIYSSGDVAERLEARSRAGKILDLNENLTQCLGFGMGPVDKEVQANHSLEDQAILSALTDLVQAHMQNGSIVAAEQLMGQPEFAGITHQEAYTEAFAKALNGVTKYSTALSGEKEGPVILAGQLMAIANRRYYDSGLGVGRTGQSGEAISAFTTPLTYDKEYRDTYVNATVTAFEKLSQEREFSSSNPFTIINIGDGEGILSESIIQSFVERGLDLSLIKIYTIDSSNTLLAEQHQRLSNFIAQGLQLETVNARVEDLSEFFAQKDTIVGIIIAGEELADDLPQYLIGLDSSTGMPYELGFEFDGTNSEAKVPLTPEMSRMVEVWLQAFPQYRRYLEKTQSGSGRFIGYVPFNIRLLHIIHSIATASQFEGYWLGGDYNQFFYQVDQYPSNVPAHLHLGGIADPTVSTADVFLQNAIRRIANFTADVDPGLLAYAQALGMKIDFVGRKGHFQDLVGARVTRAKHEVKKIVADVTHRLFHSPNKPGLEELDQMISTLKDLYSNYSGGRFNWVVRKGNVPPLFGDTAGLW